MLRSNFAELGERTPLGKPGTRSLPDGAYSIDNSKVKKFEILRRGVPESGRDRFGCRTLYVGS
jgi:hypothetical protein